MAQIALLCPDLLFGSKIEGALGAAGHKVHRIDTVEDARVASATSELLIVDLTAEAGERASVLEGLATGRTLAFYSHVEAETRRLAERAGFDRVVPRSRMARETVALVEGMLA